MGGKSTQLLVFVFYMQVFSLLGGLVQAQNTVVKQPDIHRNAGFLDFNGYYDSRKFSVVTINMLAKLSHRFQYFSLTNYEGAKETTDLGQFFSEQNVRWNPKKEIPLDLTAQWVIRNGKKNDDLRLGVRLRLHHVSALKKIFSVLNLSYSANLHFLQFRRNTPTKYIPQLEHVYKFNILPKLLKNRVYVGGFADQNMIYSPNEKPTIKWVSEHQLGIMFLKQCYAVVEFRINDFLPTQNYGLGYGLEYKIVF